MEESRLKPQDVVLALKLVAGAGTKLPQQALAQAIHLSSSEVNHGLKRLAACHLFNPREERVIRANLREFLFSGLRYVFPTQLGLFGEGMPTAFSVGPLAKKLRFGDEEGVVWQVAGQMKPTARGRVIAPLYRTVPQAAAEDPVLHEYLALVDTLRVGRAREQAMAREELSKRLST